MRRNHEFAVKSVMVFLLTLAALLGALPGPDGGNAVLAKVLFPQVRFHFKIDPKTPDADLLPVPPVPSKLPALIDDLTQAPEIFFEKPATVDPKLANHAKLSDEEKQKIFAKVLDGKHKAMADIAHQIAKIDHLNKQKPDRFLEVLLAARPDLQGLPFVMGDACRLSKARSREFAHAASVVRGLLGMKPKPFWTNIAGACQVDHDHRKEIKPEDVGRARTAALMQILGAEPAEFHVGLAEHLGKQADADATRALARLAAFSLDDPVRRTAVAALRKRKPAEYAPILVAGLRYPWPKIARHAADAVADLERRELAPELIGLLDEPDPRAPFFKEVKGQKTALAREVVRINHQRNCLLCHAPGLDVESTRETAVGAVPTPDLPLDLFSTGYGSLSPDIVVRADVTYLRPDFSLMQNASNPGPWPALQRYDFLVRTRTLSAAEAVELQQALTNAGTKPYREAALSALRRLTGTNPGDSAEAWRRWLAERTKEGG